MGGADSLLKAGAGRTMMSGRLVGERASGGRVGGRASGGGGVRARTREGGPLSKGRGIGMSGKIRGQVCGAVATVAAPLGTTTTVGYYQCNST